MTENITMPPKKQREQWKCPINNNKPTNTMGRANNANTKQDHDDNQHRHNSTTASETERIMAHCLAPALKDGGRRTMMIHPPTATPSIHLFRNSALHHHPIMPVVTTARSATKESTWVSRYNRNVARKSSSSASSSTNDKSSAVVHANASATKSKSAQSEPDAKKRKAMQDETSAAPPPASKKRNSNESSDNNIIKSDLTKNDEGTNSNTTTDPTKQTPAAIDHPPWYDSDHPYSKRFPTLNCKLLVNTLNRQSILGEIHMENVLREIVNFKTHVEEELMYHAGSNRRRLVSIPTVKDRKAFYKRAVRDGWIESMLRMSLCSNARNNNTAADTTDTTAADTADDNNNDNVEDAVGCIVEYLVKRHKKAVVKSLEGLNVVIKPSEKGCNSAVGTTGRSESPIIGISSYRTNEEKDEKAKWVRMKLGRKKAEH